MAAHQDSPQFAFGRQRVEITAWVDETTTATATTPTRVTKPSVALEIPLDGALPIRTKPGTESGFATDIAPQPSRVAPRPAREPLRRDSLKRRDALLKGKEGSRRRQRWENDRLLNNPWAQPPEASDWDIRPTYPRVVVPYFLAPLWDVEIAAKQDAEAKRRAARARANAGLAGVKNEAVGHVPRDLRSKLKRAKGAKNMLKELEEEVRRFVTSWEAKQQRLNHAGLDDIDSDEDEVVFVGRNGQMHDLPPSPKRGHAELDFVQREKLMIESAVDDPSASHRRWLVHSIATYYGLNTWSVTVGNRREAYVAIKPMKTGKSPTIHLPRPLWGLV